MASPLFPEVTVNGAVIAPEAIAEEAQHHPAPAGKPGLAWRAAARALVVRALLVEAAGRAGLEAEPRPRGPGRVETVEEALIRAYLELRITPEPVTEAQCRRVWKARPPEAAELAYDEVARDIRDALERRAWARAARALVGELVAAAEIGGIDMAPAV